ncbi:AAA family ATPase [Nonomuraea sp. CA-218870]|uniref:cytidylate kinase-like family protein n=1 Tax=Nonomuraea sp. CA-218870 TaxID=3239998 RepID=UPI003D9391D2
MHVVTLSATYGTAGHQIGPAVAGRLGVPFVDRAIAGAVAEELGCSLEEALAYDDRAEHGLRRLLFEALRLPTVTFGGVDMYVPGALPRAPEEFVRRTERVLHETARSQGGVFLGRAGAIVLAGLPGALHVRLDAPLERRVRRVAGLRRTTEHEAREVIENNDRARSAYVRHFYRADAADPRHYHLMVDSTAIPVAACADLIVMAAEALA